MVTERNPSVGVETTKEGVRIVTLLMQQFSRRTEPAVNWSVEVLLHTVLHTEVRPELNVGIKTKNVSTGA